MIANEQVRKIIDSIIPLTETQDWDYYVPHILSELNKAEIIQPDCAEIFLWKGIAYTGIADEANAEIQFKKAIELNPHYSEAYLQLAGLQRDNDISKSMIIYEHILSFDKHCFEAWRNLISILKYLKQTERVDLEVENLLTSNPDSPDACIIASNAYTAAYVFEKPDYERALKYINMAQLLSPGKADIYYQRFYILYNLKRYTEALQDLDTQKKLGSKTVLHHNYNMVYKALKKFDEALEICTREINNGYSNYYSYRERALVYREMGEWNNALNDLDAALKSCPKYESDFKMRLYSDKAEIYSLAKDHKMALQNIDKALDNSGNKHMRCEFLLRKAEFLILDSDKEGFNKLMELLKKEYSGELELPYFKATYNALKEKS